MYHELQQRLAQRDAWISLRQQVRNQRYELTQQPVVVAAVVARMDALLATLDAQIAEVEAELRPAMAGDAAWAAAARRLETIKGIGLVTVLWILAITLNFSVCGTPEAAAAYSGLAPREDESGTSVRRRKGISKAGNARLRMALYMATLSAAQSNPAIKIFYTRLRTAGKMQKIARCAAAGKLLHIAWAVVVNERMWEPDYHQARAASAQFAA